MARGHRRGGDGSAAVDERLHLADEPLERLGVVRRRLLRDHGLEAELHVRREPLRELLRGPVPERRVVVDPDERRPVVLERGLQTRTASASESRIVTLTPSVNSMSAGSRPTSSQCCLSTATLCVTTSSSPMPFHRSAYLATVRSVFFSPPPPIMIGRWAWSGQRGVAQVVERVVAAGRRGHGLAVEQVAARGHRLVEPVEALAEAGPEVDAVRGVLRLHPGAAEAEDRPAAGDVVERRGELGHEPRVAERVGADEQADLRLLRRHRRRASGSPSPRRSAGTGRRRSRTGGPTPRGGRSRAGRRGGRNRGRTASRWPGSRGGRRASGHACAHGRMRSGPARAGASVRRGASRDRPRSASGPRPRRWPRARRPPSPSTPPRPRSRRRR